MKTNGKTVVKSAIVSEMEQLVKAFTDTPSRRECLLIAEAMWLYHKQIIQKQAAQEPTSPTIDRFGDLADEVKSIGEKWHDRADTALAS